MSLRKLAPTLFDRRARYIQTPIIIVRNAISCIDEKTGDIAAKIQNLATFPNGPLQGFVKVGELCLAF